MIKRCFIDLETTGLDMSCAVIQISGIIDINGKEVDKFDFKVAPFSTDRIDDAALIINRISVDDLNKFEDPLSVFDKLYCKLKEYCYPYDKKDKYFFIGYNSRFDYDRLRNWYTEKCKKDYFGSWFWFPPVDIMTIAADLLVHKRSEMENFKLETVLKTFNIETDESKLHDGMYDIEQTRKLYYRINFESLINKVKNS